MEKVKHMNVQGAFTSENKKRRIRFNISLCCIFLCIIFVCLSDGCMKKWQYEMGKYEIKDFKTNQQSFDIIATKLLGFYAEEKRNNIDLSFIIVFQTPQDDWELTCGIDLNNANDYTLCKTITQEEKDAYESISKLFSQTEARGLYFVKVLEDRVIFASYTPYTIIYMKNGKKPSYLLSENEAYESLYVEKLSAKWYQASGHTSSYLENKK
jgi:hypothetical protein